MKRHGALITPIIQQACGRWGFDDYWTTGKRRQISRETKGEAQKAWDDLSVLISNGRKDLISIDGLELARFRAWEASQNSSITVATAVSEFLAEKKQDGDAKQKWLRVLSDALRLFSDQFGDAKLASVNAQHIEKWLRSLRLSQRTWNNIRGPLVQLSRWARGKRYLPDATSEAERVKRYKIKKTETITHWTADEMSRILAAASDDDRVWYLLTAFSGVRTEELMPEYRDKDPLRWEDFDWVESIIHLRMGTSKVGEPRNVHISDQLAAWLAPYRGRRGPCIPIGRRARVITRHIKDLTGLDHRQNANRHSYGIYRRTEIKSLATVAEEMGTSESRVKVNYSRPTNPSELAKWKAIMPVEARKIVAMPVSQPTHKKSTQKRANQGDKKPVLHR